MKGFVLVLMVFSLISCEDKTASHNKTRKEVEVSKVAKSYSPLHQNLSTQFVYQSSIVRIPTDYFDSCFVEIIVKEKSSGNIVFKTDIVSDYLLGQNTFEGNNVRSYISGENVEQQIVDGDFGDIVVADLNFDGREDFAAKRDEGGNAGPKYNFYIQTTEGKFIQSKFLSDSVIWFPSTIDKNQQNLKTLVRANAYSICETTYQYDEAKDCWGELERKYYK